MKLLNSILIKPAGPDCNMDCRYCFYLEKSALFPGAPAHRMGDEILATTVKQAMEADSGSISFSWQGGEPTLMGLEFFRSAVRHQQHYGRGQSVGNALQTNGILLDDQWASFLRSYHFLVGLSIDGPEHIHDHYRLDRGGKGTWSQVRDRAKLLLDAGVAVNALAVVNDYSVRFAEEIYSFLKELGLPHMQFIPCLEPDPDAPTMKSSFSAPADAYGRFLARLFDLWLADFDGLKPTTFIRFFDSVFFTYVNLTPPDCTLLSECGNYLVIEHNGDVYSCDFYVEPRWKLGNVLKSGLVSMLNTEQQASFGRIKSAIADSCRQCRWLPYCRGGCPRNRRFNIGDPQLDHFCESYKMFFSHAHGRLKDLAARMAKERESMAGLDGSPAARSGRNSPCPCGSGRKYKKCCGA